MELAAISMVRNEADIIAVWLSHLLSLFDFVFIADHCSDDGTFEYLQAVAAKEVRLNVVRYMEPEYSQSAVFHILRQRCIESCAAEWVFILDADEFLGYDSWQKIRNSLESIESYDVLHFNWRNCFPKTPGLRSHRFDGFQENRLSPFGKIAIRRNVAEDVKYRIPNGAHRLHHQEYGSLNGFSFGELYHFPVRTNFQIWNKVLQGCQSYLEDSSYVPGLGIHWFWLLDFLMKNGADWELAPALVKSYGEKQIEMTNALRYFEPRRFSFCKQDNKGLSEPPDSTSSTVAIPSASPELSRRLRRLLSLDLEGRTNMQLKLVDGEQIKHANNFEGKKFGPIESSELPTSITVAEIVDGLQSSFWDIRFPVASAWGEHIPFQYSLVSLIRPRRYVELGVHNGASFLATCEAILRLGLVSEAVAIDSWLGDAHAGKHSPQVFEEFRQKLATTYCDFAGYIKKDFSSAVSQFENASIDLLHIDGFHTADAVRRDFNTWIEKLTDRGVVLFHDTNEFKEDFGVWRFWKNVRSKYPFVEFGHGHGLGVLVVGENSPLRCEIEGTRFRLTSPEANDILQVIYGNVGRIVWEDARRRLSTAAEIDLMQAHITEREVRASQLHTHNCDLEASLVELRARNEILETRIAELNAQTDNVFAQHSDLKASLDAAERRLKKYDKSMYGRLRREILRVRRKIQTRKTSGVGGQ